MTVTTSIITDQRSGAEHRRLQIMASRLATGIFAGEYRSAFRGRGIEFDEVREYQPGDDIRTIDWNVTARQDRPFIKRFIEERELTVLFVLDRSSSMAFGTVRCTKGQAAAEACTLLAFAALRSNDRVGLLTVGNRVENYLPPAKGKRHLLRLVRELSPPAGSGVATDLQVALDHLVAVVRGRALLFLVSDFLTPLPVTSLAATARRHDVVALVVSDPAEETLPDAGLLRLADAETGAVRLVDSCSAAVRAQYAASARARRTERTRQIIAAGADLIEISTSTSPLHPLARFFRDRRRAGRR